MKTDRRDANALSELLWINRYRIENGKPIAGVRRVVVPRLADLENQRITMLRQQAGRQRTRTATHSNSPETMDRSGLVALAAW